MSYPTLSEYQDAIQNPKTCFLLPELKTSQPELDRFGIPRPYSGNFAVVFPVSFSNKKWAVRCFARDLSDRELRYRAINRYLNTNKLSCMVDFEFIQQGIKIRNNWYPILKMEWVDGLPINKYIENNLLNPKKIIDLRDKFYAMVTELQKFGVSHGDFQHGNILVSNNQLKLVDYDCMFVPGLKGLKSNELGHINYQHPKRSANDFGPHIDNISSWCIYLSLEALGKEPTLWKVLDAGDENLLFKKHDLEYPATSNAFRVLERVSDKNVKYITECFRKALEQKNLALVPSLNAKIAINTNLLKFYRPPIQSSIASKPTSSGRSPIINISSKTVNPRTTIQSSIRSTSGSTTSTHILPKTTGIKSNNKLYRLFNKFRSSYFQSFTIVAGGGYLLGASTLRWSDNSLMGFSQNLILLSIVLALGILIIARYKLSQIRQQSNAIKKLNILSFFCTYFTYFVLFASFSRFYLITPTLLNDLIVFIILFSLVYFLHRLARININLALFFLCTYTFFLLFIPVVIKIDINSWFFKSIAAFLSLGLTSIVAVFTKFDISSKYIQFTSASLLHSKRKSLLAHSLFSSAIICLFTLIMIHAMAIFEILPQFPLSLFYGGVFHDVKKDYSKSIGHYYVLKYGLPPWYKPWVKDDRVFKIRKGNEDLYVFISVFAPRGVFKSDKNKSGLWCQNGELRDKTCIKLLKKLQKYDSDLGNWVTKFSTNWWMRGGRCGGYRMLYKVNVKDLQLGNWRVRVETNRGNLVGKIYFSVESESSVSFETASVTY